MKSLFKIGLIFITIVGLQACSKPQENEDQAMAQPQQLEESKKLTPFKTYSAEEFFKTTTVFGSSINHDTTAVLMNSDESGIFNLYRVPLDGSPVQQLTHSSKESIFAVSWFPNDDRLLYLSDQGGNELDHLYLRELDGAIKDLTPGDNHKAEFVGWHQNTQQFYVTTNERDSRFFDLYLYQSTDYSRKMIYQNDKGFEISQISPDGNWLVTSLSNSNADSDLFLIDLTSNVNSPQLITPQLITEHQGDVSHNAYTFSHDSKKLIYGTNEFGEFNQAWSYDINTKQKKIHYKADWDVSFIYYSKDGKYQISGVNADAQTKLEILNVKTGEKVTLPKTPAGDLRGVNFSVDSSTLVFYITSDTSPSNLFVHKMGSGKVQRLTNTGNPNIDEKNLVASQVIRFKSFDGLEIPGLLFKPKQASTAKVPALIFIHGGPGGQSRKGYSALIQHLVNNGYAIFSINNRGSSGYGKTFYHLDDKKHGEDDLQDVVYNKKYLQSLDWVDNDRIGVVGGSYGGYLTMAAMTFTNEFEVGINIFSVTNWVRTLNNIPPYWESFKKELYDELGDPAIDGERLHRISPVFFGHQVKKPVLVVQGANDPRVLKIESDEMVEAIRKGGTYVDYLVFDDEGHGFSKKKNRIAASKKYLSFLDQYLKK